MRRCAIRWAARLYPLAWRRRYAAEFEALLEDAGGGWGTAADVLKGALMMQIKSGTIWKAMVACGLAGALAAGIALARLPKRYKSIAVLRADTSDPAQLPARLNAIQQEVLSRPNLERVIIENGLYRDARTRQPIEDIVIDMRKDIFIRPVGAKGPHGLFRISYEGDTADGAQAVTRALVGGFMDQNVEQLRESRREGNDVGEERLELLDPPSISRGASWPHPVAWIAIGLAGGALVGLGAGGILHRLFRPSPAKQS